MNTMDRLRNVSIEPKPTTPLWGGPEGEGPQGGVTQSMIAKFLNCKERFRVLTVEGLRPTEKWNHRTGYGEMFHLCEEWWNRSGNATTGNIHGQPDWKLKLAEYAGDVMEKYPLQAAEVEKWYNVCLVQFPIYLDYWKARPEQQPRTSLLQEEVFDVRYVLPSGRTVRLRGKWDGVSLVGRGRDSGVWLEEHKTKGEVDETRICRQLTWDLQVMTYLVALEGYRDDAIDEGILSLDIPIKGVRYQVVRRPLSGGKGTIVRHKPTKKNPEGESGEEYYERLGQYIKDEPHTYFYRWEVAITPDDIERFKREFLNPCLEFMCVWWEHIQYNMKKGDPPYFCSPAPGNDVQLHWRHPFGVHNSLDEGGSSDLDSYLESGTTVGLRKVDTLFRELE